MPVSILAEVMASWVNDTLAHHHSANYRSHRKKREKQADALHAAWSSTKDANGEFSGITPDNVKAKADKRKEQRARAHERKGTQPRIREDPQIADTRSPGQIADMQREAAWKERTKIAWNEIKKKDNQAYADQNKKANDDRIAAEAVNEYRSRQARIRSKSPIRLGIGLPRRQADEANRSKSPIKIVPQIQFSANYAVPPPANDTLVSAHSWMGESQYRHGPNLEQNFEPGDFETSLTPWPQPFECTSACVSTSASGVHALRDNAGPQLPTMLAGYQATTQLPPYLDSREPPPQAPEAAAAPTEHAPTDHAPTAAPTEHAQRDITRRLSRETWLKPPSGPPPTTAQFGVQNAAAVEPTAAAAAATRGAASGVPRQADVHQALQGTAKARARTHRPQPVRVLSPRYRTQGTIQNARRSGADRTQGTALARSSTQRRAPPMSEERAPMPRRWPPESYCCDSFRDHDQIAVDTTVYNPDGARVEPDEEFERRLVRDKAIKDSLNSGHPIEYQSTGGSLTDAGVPSGNHSRFEPIDKWRNPEGSDSDSRLKVGDIVFCEVQPKSANYGGTMRKNVFYAHMVNTIGVDITHRHYYVISGARGYPGDIMAHWNGWCYIEHIYGVLTHTGPTPQTLAPYSNRRDIGPVDAGVYVNRREYIR
jgi:hypothetical protein